jgi:hypothetical protein
MPRQLLACRCKYRGVDREGGRGMQGKGLLKPQNPTTSQRDKQIHKYQSTAGRASSRTKGVDTVTSLPTPAASPAVHPPPPPLPARPPPSPASVAAAIVADVPLPRAVPATVAAPPPAADSSVAAAPAASPPPASSACFLKASTSSAASTYSCLMRRGGPLEAASCWACSTSSLAASLCLPACGTAGQGRRSKGKAAATAVRWHRQAARMEQRVGQAPGVYTWCQIPPSPNSPTPDNTVSSSWRTPSSPCTCLQANPCKHPPPPPTPPPP